MLLNVGKLDKLVIEAGRQFQTLGPYGLNGDSFDWLRRPSIYSTDHDTESVHWFNLLRYKNTNWDLTDDQPIRPILDLPISTFLFFI